MTVDLDSAAGRYRLHAMIACADVVIEASRPRALEQLGINATEILTTESPRVWASITGYGRGGEDRNRVAFGDDAAVAGGLVSWTDDMPVFTADAVADPASGVVAAAAILDALSTSQWRLVDNASRIAATGCSTSRWRTSPPTSPDRPCPRRPDRSHHARDARAVGRPASVSTIRVSETDHTANNALLPAGNCAGEDGVRRRVSARDGHR
jgi:hypothetical protein